MLAISNVSLNSIIQSLTPASGNDIQKELNELTAARSSGKGGAFLRKVLDTIRRSDATTQEVYDALNSLVVKNLQNEKFIHYYPLSAITEAKVAEKWKVIFALSEVFGSAEKAGITDPKDVIARIEDFIAASKAPSCSSILALSNILLNTGISPEAAVSLASRISIDRFYKVNIAELMLNRIQNKPDGRPLAVVILPSRASDWNQVFLSEDNDINYFISNGYRVMYYEISTDEEFYASLKDAAGNQRAKLIFLGGHGTPRSITFGKRGAGPKERYELDPGDREEMIKNKLGIFLESRGQVILSSCSVGRGGQGANNIANLLKDIFPLAGHIWSAQKDAGISSISFGFSREVEEVSYGFGADSSEPFDPMAAPFECSSFLKNVDSEYIPILLSGIKETPPILGVEDKAVSALLCIANRGVLEQRTQVISGLVAMLEDEGSYDTAKGLLSATGPDSLFMLVESLRRSRKPLGAIMEIAGRQNKDLFKTISDRWYFKWGYYTSETEVPEVPYALWTAKKIDLSTTSRDLTSILLNERALPENRRMAARFLGEVGEGSAIEALEDVLGVGLFNLRDDDGELCRISLESLIKIKAREDGQ